MSKPTKSRARATAAPKARLLPDRRRRMIIDGATRYFAEGGWTSGTTGLAKQLGITQPLLFRYFPNKEKLIEAVYDNIFATMWDARWEAMICDREVPLRARLSAFYSEYFHRVLTRDYCRLTMYASLAGYEPGLRYFPFLRVRVFPAIVRELIAARPRLRSREAPRTEDAIEIVLTLHAAIYHLAVRRWIFSPPLKGDIDKLIAFKVSVFLDGALAATERLQRGNHAMPSAEAHASGARRRQAHGLIV
jgi:AcrR family transcriptional regulator